MAKGLIESLFDLIAGLINSLLGQGAPPEIAMTIFSNEPAPSDNIKREMVEASGESAAGTPNLPEGIHSLVGNLEPEPQRYISLSGKVYPSNDYIMRYGESTFQTDPNLFQPTNYPEGERFNL